MTSTDTQTCGSHTPCAKHASSQSNAEVVALQLQSYVCSRSCLLDVVGWPVAFGSNKLLRTAGDPRFLQCSVPNMGKTAPFFRGRPWAAVFVGMTYFSVQAQPHPPSDNDQDEIMQAFLERSGGVHSEDVVAFNEGDLLKQVFAAQAQELDHLAGEQAPGQQDMASSGADPAPKIGPRLPYHGPDSSASMLKHYLLEKCCAVQMMPLRRRLKPTRRQKDIMERKQQTQRLNRLPETLDGSLGGLCRPA